MYSIPDIDHNEVVRLTIFEDRSRVVIDRGFYLVTGVEMECEVGREYYVRFITGS